MTGADAHHEAAAALVVACGCLEERRYPDAVGALEGQPATPATMAVLRLAEAVRSANDGDAEGADRAMREVDGAAIPFPAILRHCGRHFLERGDSHTAHHWYAQLQTYEPGVIQEFLNGLPVGGIARYSPWLRSEVVTAAAWSLVEDELTQRLGQADAERVVAHLRDDEVDETWAVHVAGAHLDEDRPHEALEAVHGCRGAAADSARQLALARIAERARAGDAAYAHALEAFALGVPHAALLRACMGRMRAAGDLRRAHECASLLQHLDASAMPEFLGSLDGPPLSYLAPRVLDRARRPGAWSLWRMKRALVARIGPAAAGVAYGYASPAADRSEVRTFPIVSLQEWASRHADDYDVLHAGRPVHLASPRIFGTPRGGGLRTHSRTLFLAQLQDVVVASKSNFLLHAGQALLDFQDDELERVAVQWDVDAPLLASNGDAATFVIDGTAHRAPAVPRALSLVGLNTKNFGHWLLEFIPALWMCRGREDLAGLALIVDADMPPQHFEALRMFASDDHPLVVLKPGDAVRVENLWTYARIQYYPIAPALGAASRADLMVYDVEAVEQLLRVAEERLPAPGDGPRRLFLARSDDQHRHMVNRAEVEAWFAANGFEIVDFGRLEFAEQVRLIRDAEIVVGPDGSSLVMTIFGRPGLRVGILDNHHLQDNECWAALCERLGQPLLYLVGDVVGEAPMYQYHADYRIPVDSLPPFLDALVELELEDPR